MGRKVEGYWDCQYCGTKEIGGLTKICPNCGKPQSKGVKFYLKSGPKRYLDSEVAKDYGKGADWVCPSCGSYNRYNDTTCKNCGTSRKEAKEDYFGNPINSSSESNDEDNSESNTESEKNHEPVSKPSYEKPSYDFGIEGSSFSNHEKSDTESTYISEPIFEKANNNFEKSSDDFSKANALTKISDIFSEIGDALSYVDLSKVLLVGGGIAGVVAVIVLLVSIFTPKTYSAKITAKSWERSITVEELRTFDENGWYIPDGARVYDSREEIRYYDQVVDHYETRSYQVSRQEFDHYEYEYRDNGDGTFDEVSVPVYKTVYDTEYEQVPIYVDVPVYDTKYYYEIDRWCYKRTETASGTDKDEVCWPDVEYNSLERKGNTSEVYKIDLKTINTKDTKTKSYSKNLSYDDWKAYDEGMIVTITVVAGIVTKVERPAY